MSLSEMKARGKGVVDLSISNPTQVGLDLPDPFQVAPPTSDGYSPLASGAKATLEAISRYYLQEFQTDVPAENILLTSSTSEAYSYCFKMIADPGDTILIPQPSYPLLQFLVEAESLEARHYPVHRAGGEWVLDREALARACTLSTRAIVIVHPNNPTGHFLSDEDLQWLVDFSRDRLWLISDEVFADYIWTERPPTTRSLSYLNAENALILSGLSKICALPQMKLAWIAMPPDPALHAHLELVADTYLSVTTPIQNAAVEWLKARGEFQTPVQTRCLENLGAIRRRLEGTAWNLQNVEAGWVAIVQGPSHLEEEALALSLLSRGFYVHPGYFYDLPFQPAFVLSLLTPPEHMQLGLEAMLST